MKVFHGSTVIVNSPLVGVGRRNLDFGKGFYVTDLKEQAISWASRPSNADKPQVLNIYEFDKDGVLKDNYQYKQFMAYDVEWLEFVVASRKGQPVWQVFDVIEGGIANDRIFNTIEQPNNQICILNQKVADNYLHFIEFNIVNEEEKKE